MDTTKNYECKRLSKIKCKNNWINMTKWKSVDRTQTVADRRKQFEYHNYITIYNINIKNNNLNKICMSNSSQVNFSAKQKVIPLKFSIISAE